MLVQREEFVTFEEELDRFRDLGSRSPPTAWGGPKRFFAGLKPWLTPAVEAPARQPAAVYPDPGLNLSLPYAGDELTMVLAVHLRRMPSAEELANLAERFGLQHDLLARPVAAMSGGERMAVSICKATELAKLTNQLLVCSPFFWLDEEHRSIVDGALRSTAAQGIQTNLLVLQGEDTREDLVFTFASQPPVFSWDLRLQAPEVKFPEVHFPRHVPEKRIRFQTTATLDKLGSPTLIQGRNGIGKTTLAKLLTGIVSPSRGAFKIQAGGFGGLARLLLQDTSMHLFGHTPEAHLARVFAGEKEALTGARRLFSDLQHECAGVLARFTPGASVGPRDDPSSVLQGKLALVAERLARPTPLLILDEPGWCLSRPLAKAFVNSVVKAAHARSTAVAIVSHQADWWADLAAERISLSSEGNVGDVVVARSAQ